VTVTLELLEMRADATQFLYDLLAERRIIESISHKRMPSPEEHAAFLAAGPYRAHYIVINDDVAVGHCYLSYDSNIGIFIASKHQHKGIGKKAVMQLMQLWHSQAPFTANIAPYNEASKRFFASLGFHPLQITYEKD
jgi:RimJ/RimL family protein N-acetyltransferase